jgi:ribose transport system substrate-binding protein
MGNRGDELALWKDLKASGYQTYSISSTPGMSTIAFWIAQQVLAGKKVPNTVNVPLLAIHEDTLDAWMAATPVGTAASPNYGKEDSVALIDATVAGKSGNDLPQPRVPH